MDSRETLSRLKQSFCENGASCVNSSEFLENLLSVVEACRVPRREEFDERPATYADFSESWRSTTSDLLSFLPRVIGETVREKKKTVEGIVPVELDKLCPAILVLIAEQSHDENQPWVVIGADTLCRGVEKALEELFGVKTVEEFLSIQVHAVGKGKKSKIPLHAACLELLKVQFAEEKWKANAGVACAFCWIFTRIKFPNLFPAVDLAFAPLVRLLDDFVAENHIFGLQCVRHLVQNVTPTELSWHGRRDVLARLVSLLRLEEDIHAVELRQECIVALLSIAVKSAATDDFSFELMNEIDERFEEVLDNAKFLQPSSSLRTLLIGFIPKYLEIYGIHGVRYTDVIVKMLLENLSTSIRDDRAREVALEVLVDVLRNHLWPVLSPRIPDILATIVVCSRRASPSPESRIEKLLRTCVQLCRELSPEKFDETVKGVDLKSENYRILDVAPIRSS